MLIFTAPYATYTKKSPIDGAVPPTGKSTFFPNNISTIYASIGATANPQLNQRIKAHKKKLYSEKGV
jgi:hypothetical protein